jgi:glycosyltransferase involved in cell wall biosynthesis
MKNRRTGKPLFSVIIANYNYGLFIEEAINSVIDQTIPARDVEIIVVDDGSRDDSREKIGKYGSRLKAFYQENRGQASAFNRGMQKGKSSPCLIQMIYGIKKNSRE